MIWSRTVALAALLSAAFVGPTIASAARTSFARSAPTPAHCSSYAQPKNRVRAFSLGSDAGVVDEHELRAEIASGKSTQPTRTRVRRASYGKEHDTLADLYYYGKRYFDPLSLTWTQADPLFRFVPDAAWDEPRRANLYTFDLNNPVRYVDPDGLNPSIHPVAMGCAMSGSTCVEEIKHASVGKAVEYVGNAASFVPGIGTAGDAVSTLGSVMQGDWGGAAIAAATIVIPGLGAGEAKLGAEIVEEGAEFVAKHIDEAGVPAKNFDQARVEAFLLG